MYRLARLLSAGGASLLAAATVALAGTASAAAESSPITFSGQCQLAGSVSFKPRMTNVPQPVRNQASATGTCTGTLTGSDGSTTTLSNAPVSYRAVEFGTQDSCEANPNAPGSGELIFAQGKLGFQIVENRVSGTAQLSLTGNAGGSATAVATVNSSDPAGILEQCANKGVKSVPVNLTIQTTPAISG